MNRLIPSHENVLIKPNFVNREAYPTTTSPDSIKALINEVKNVTGGIIEIGDQGWREQPEIYAFLNMYEEIKKTDGVLISFSETYRVRLKSAGLQGFQYEVYKDVYEAPIIINLCTLKRHGGANMTCALKNNVGSVPGPYGLRTRNYLHSFNPLSLNFLRKISDIASLINPELNIVDARDIMIKNGPNLSRRGAEIKKGVNRLILCGDMVATDAYCAQLLQEHDKGFSAESVMPTLQRAQELGLGTWNMNEVCIIETQARQKEFPKFRDRKGYKNKLNKIHKKAGLERS